MVRLTLTREVAARYALLALTARSKKVRFDVDLQVGEARDEVCIFRLPGEHVCKVLYIDGSDLDNTLEWRSNLRKYCGGDFGGAVPAILALIENQIREGEELVIVGYSRGASIAVAVGELSDKERYVVTVGDPGLATSDENNVTSLFNQFDFVYGLVGDPTGEKHQVSHARWRWDGWALKVDDVGRHTNYQDTLVDDAQGT